MSIETIYKCDHCGTRCSGDELATIAEWKEPTTITFGKTVHGCSKEHLGIALAKMFGIGVNGEADELLNRKQRELTKLTAELEARMPANEVTIELQRKRIAALEKDAEEKHAVTHAYIVSLEKRIAEMTTPMTIDGKTPGQVANEGYERASGSRTEAWEASAQAVLRAFGNFPLGQTPQTNAVEALRRVRNAMFPNPHGPSDPEAEYQMGIIDAEIAKLEASPATISGHVHELGARLICDKSPPDTSTESGLPDAVLAAITLPTKPTKPLRERLEELATYWYRDDKDDKELNGAYRLARRECAKELREVINDPR